MIFIALLFYFVLILILFSFFFVFFFVPCMFAMCSPPKTKPKKLVRTLQPIKPVKIFRSGRQNCQTEVGTARNFRVKSIDQTVRRPDFLIASSPPSLSNQLFDIATGEACRNARTAVYPIFHPLYLFKLLKCFLVWSFPFDLLFDLFFDRLLADCRSLLLDLSYQSVCFLALFKSTLQLKTNQLMPFASARMTIVKW